MRPVKTPGKIGASVHARPPPTKFMNLAAAPPATKRHELTRLQTQRAKIFCFFFSKKKTFFFEKKKQKTFTLLGACARP